MDEATATFLDAVSAALKRIPPFTTPPDHPSDGWAPRVDASRIDTLWLGLDAQRRQQTRDFIDGIAELCDSVTRHSLVARQVCARLALECGDEARAAALYGVTPDALPSAMSAELRVLDELEERLGEWRALDELEDTRPWLRLVRDPVATEDEPLADEPAAIDAREPQPDLEPSAEPEFQLDADVDHQPTPPPAPAPRTPDAPDDSGRPGARWPHGRALAAVAACVAIALIAVAIPSSSRDPSDATSQREPRQPAIGVVESGTQPVSGQEASDLEPDAGQTGSPEAATERNRAPTVASEPRPDHESEPVDRRRRERGPAVANDHNANVSSREAGDQPSKPARRPLREVTTPGELATVLSVPMGTIVEIQPDGAGAYIVLVQRNRDRLRDPHWARPTAVKASIPRLPAAKSRIQWRDSQGFAALEIVP